jgi:hypothetical protein
MSVTFFYYPVCHFPEDWKAEDLGDFEELWMGPLKLAIPFSSVICSHHLKKLEDSPNSKVCV